MKTQIGPKRGRDDLAPSKLKLVNDYNKYMGCVVRSDTFIGNYNGYHKSFGWTVKLAFHLLRTPFSIL